MKTNFKSNLKRFAFLLIAVLGTFFSYAQSSQTTIGGSKTPDPGCIFDIGGCRPPVGAYCLEIGGRDTNGGFKSLSGFKYLATISENASSDVKREQSTHKPPILIFKNTVCEFLYPEDTGGNGGVIIGRPGIGARQDVPTMPFDIGGKGNPDPILFTVNQSNHLFTSDMSGQDIKISALESLFCDIGGQSTGGDSALY